MMKAYGMIVHGLKAIMIEVESSISRGIPHCNVIGYGNTIVKEAILRVRSAIESSGLNYPMSRITINLAPADIPKRGSQLELAMAISLLAASGQLFDGELENTCFVGELSLDGKLNQCKGVLAILLEAKNKNFKNIIIPSANIHEAELIDGLNIYAFGKLSEVVDFINKKKKVEKLQAKSKLASSDRFSKDFRDIKGQETAKRAILIAVSGGHPILMIGSPGVGKSMLAERVPGIMPPLERDEIIESSLIHSISREMTDGKFTDTPPFRRPSVNISIPSLLGSGYPPTPGEITLAHRGVLFLEEINEMNRIAVDSLRVPLDRKCVCLNKRGEGFVYPADFLLISCANPCKCGYLYSRKKECTCTPGEISAYKARLSGPISDRIDIHIFINEPDFDELTVSDGMGSAGMRRKVLKVRKLQSKRYAREDFKLNSSIFDNKIAKYCSFDSDGEAFIKNAYKTLKLTPRSMVKIRKISRTIADLDESKEIKLKHISEAIQFRQRW